jgi:hypothetical protein
MPSFAYNPNDESLIAKIGGYAIILPARQAVEILPLTAAGRTYGIPALCTKIRQLYSARGVRIVDDTNISLETEKECLDSIIKHLDKLEVSWEKMNEEREAAKGRELEYDKYMGARVEEKKNALARLKQVKQELAKKKKAEAAAATG